MKETTITQTPFISVQTVRLIDVFVIAPFCFYVASKKSLSTPIRVGLVALGVSTALFNGYNYILNQKKGEDINTKG